MLLPSDSCLSAARAPQERRRRATQSYSKSCSMLVQGTTCDFFCIYTVQTPTF
ncbi:hypothetical protein HMPREF1980_00552 [Actinomyces sp. oral taxon 172 str. F0311]|nr:hypothetical protein HMPREF1980_00552 [Actinomyces sp. oral taxon 172 str. F0311]